MPVAVEPWQHSFTKLEIDSTRSPIPNTTFPLGLRYTGDSDLEAALSAIRLLPWNDLLQQGGGALLVRGLPVHDATQISEAIRAFGVGKEYKQVGIAGIRNVVAKELLTANEGPPSLRFYQHNEWARFPRAPSKIFFACHTFTPQSGGETPLTSSIEVLNRLQEELPEFVTELSKRGLRSQQYYPAPGKEGSDNGFNWRQSSAFGEDIDDTDDEETARRKAEKAAAYHTGSTVAWTDEGALVLSMELPAIRRVASGHGTFFNGLTGRFGMIKQRGALDPPYIGTDGMKYLPPTYADGTEIPREWLLRMLEIQDEVTFQLPWQEGDIALLDNYTVQHGRTPWVGTGADRVVYTSLRDDGQELLPY